MDKNKYNYPPQHTSGNGFLLGLIVGVILTLLFTTSKGRKILRELSENGFDAINDRLKDFEGFDENVEEMEEKPSSKHSSPLHLETEVVRSPGRRLFRGIRRRS